MSTYVSRGRETNDAPEPSAGRWTSIIESVLSTPSGLPVLNSACCSGVSPVRESIPTSSRFIASPAWSPPLTSELPESGIASVRLTLASATRTRYQPQPLPASTSTLSSAAIERPTTTARADPRPPDSRAGDDPRPLRGSSRGGRGRRSPLLTVGSASDGHADGRRGSPAGRAAGTDSARQE